jgi:3-deoxy-D-manno-octulosonate 8-phosphate phosphatase (KDO 8-P phosphatase)
MTSGTKPPETGMTTAASRTSARGHPALRRVTPGVLAKAAKIRLVIFDVDGVLTDGTLYFDEQGREYKCFHVRDGHGIKLLRTTGVESAVISGRQAQSVARRMENLGIHRVYQGVEDKLSVFKSVCRELGLSPEQVAHVGDDLLDLPVMRQAGLSVAVADAHFSLLPHADWQTHSPGGKGAAREVCDLIMEAQGMLAGVIQQYF